MLSRISLQPCNTSEPEGEREGGRGEGGREGERAEGGRVEGERAEGGHLVTKYKRIRSRMF